MAAQAQQTQAPAAEAKALKPKPKAKRQKALKLRPFDKVLFAALHDGESNAMEISRRLNVDVNEFERRLTTLVNQKLIARDTSNPSLVHLTIKGFEAYAPKPKVKKAEAAAEAKAEAKPEAKAEAQPKAEAKAARKTEAKEARQVPESQPAVKTEVLDLVEQQRQSKKRSTALPSAIPPVFQPVQNAQQPVAQSAQTTAPAAAAVASEAVSDEKCQLCKKPFKLSMANASEAKYGHCFCGAAYHKDCYESLLENGSKCVHCGKKLRLILNKQSEEVVKSMRELF